MAFDINKFVQSNVASSGNGGFDLNKFLVSQGITPKNLLETPEGLEQFAIAKGVEPPKQKKTLSALRKAIGVLNVGTAFSAGALRGALSPDRGVVESAFGAASESARGDELLGFSDVAREQGINPRTRLGKAALGAGGFVADVVFDPLTYMSFGIGTGLKVGTRVLSKAGTKLFQETATELGAKLVKEEIEKLGRELTEQELKSITKTAESRARIAFEEGMGKKGIDDAAIERLKKDGFDQESILEIAKNAPKLADEGGIKMFGKTLVSNRAIAKSPIGRAAKILGETEIVQALKNTLGKTFVADFARNPKIVTLLDTGARQIRGATQEIVSTNERLFKGLSDKQMTELFDRIFQKKLEIPKALSKLDTSLKGEARASAEAALTREAKAAQRQERLIFEDPQLQKVADELFEPKKIIQNGKEIVIPGVVGRFAKLAGIPEQDAIKFYIPSVFQDKIAVRNAAFRRNGVGSANLDFLKKFTGVENENLIRNPLEAYSRGQIAVVTARIKTNTIKAVIREIGLSAREVAARGLDAKDMERLGYVKFSREGVEGVEKYTKRVLAMKEMKSLRKNLEKALGELKISKKADRATISQISKIEKGIANLVEKQKENLSKLFSTGDTPKVVVTPRKIGTLPAQLEQIGESVKKFDSFDLMDKSEVGVQLEKLELDGVLERAGFKSREAFFDRVKDPYKASKESERIIDLENIDEQKILEKLVGLQKEIERLQPKLATIKEINKKSINDSLSYLDNAIAGIQARRTEIKASGDLQRKIEGWIPKEVNEELSKMFDPKLTGIDELAKYTGFDYVTGLFKGYVTSIFPGFHVRNMTSNQFQNFLKIGVDVVNPVIQTRATQIVLGRNLDKVITTKTGKRITLGEIRERILKESDILDSGAFGRTEQFIEEAQKTTNLSKFNPLSRNNVAFQAGRKFGSAAEAQAKLVSVISAVIEGKSVKEGVKQAEDALFNYSKLTEFERSVMRRLIPFYTFARKNAEFQIKTLATNPGRVATELKAINGIGEAIGEPVTEEDIQGLPSYVLQSLGIKGAGTNKFGQPQFFSGLGLPIEEFLGRFSGDKGIIANTIGNLMAQANPVIKFPAERATGVDFFRERPITEITNGADLKVVIDGLEKASPKLAEEFKKLVQWAEIPGKAVYANGKVVDRETKYTANPFVLHFMRNLFTSRIQSTIGFVSGDDQTNMMKALRFFTGVRGWSIDTEQQKFYNDLNRSQELKDFLIRMGLISKFETVFVPKERSTLLDDF